MRLAVLATGRGFPGSNKNLVFPPSTISAVALCPEAITGTPQAIASMPTLGSSYRRLRGLSSSRRDESGPGSPRETDAPGTRPCRARLERPRLHVLRQAAISRNPQHEHALEFQASGRVATPFPDDGRPSKRRSSSGEVPALRYGCTTFGLGRVLPAGSPAQT